MKTRLGTISIRTNHPFSSKHNGYHISPFFQELIVYAGHLECYEGSEAILKKFTDVEVCASQVYRITDTYGQQLLDQAQPERTLPPVGSDDVLYVEIDGGMVLTRPDKTKQKETEAVAGETQSNWREIKLSRMFRASDCLHPDGKRGFIKQSQYLGGLGTLSDFTQPLTETIDSYDSLKDRLVFITDGATWIRNLIADAYPQAISILDFYHAMEHLYEFANLVFDDNIAKKQWCKKQEALLLDSLSAQVIINIEQVTASEQHKQAAQELIQYYTNNQSRMDYKRYRQIGCGIIGSGAIESAHRTVVQIRMKLSGQRWSIHGAKAMLQLRVTACNGQWNKVIQLVKQKFKAAA